MPAFTQIRPWYNVPILGPYAIAKTALTTVAQTVLDADRTRTGVIFHNPGTTYAKRVLPLGASLVGGAGGILIYPQSEYILIQDEDSQFNVNAGWQAVTDNNADGTLTILDFTAATPGAPMVQPTIRREQAIQVDSPVATETTIGAGSTAILAADRNRHGVEFHNPSAVNMAVCPDNLAAAIGAGSIVILPGGSKRIVGNDRVRVNCGWRGIAASGGQIITALSLYG